jgi:hypothetical protein
MGGKMRIKYVIAISSRGEENPFIFAEHGLHGDFFSTSRCVSAGFVHIYYNEEKKEIDCECTGESVSLEVTSRGVEDEKLIKKYILNVSPASGDLISDA